MRYGREGDCLRVKLLACMLDQCRMGLGVSRPVDAILGPTLGTFM